MRVSPIIKTLRLYKFSTDSSFFQIVLKAKQGLNTQLLFSFLYFVTQNSEKKQKIESIFSNWKANIVFAKILKDKNRIKLDF